MKCKNNMWGRAFIVVLALTMASWVFGCGTGQLSYGDTSEAEDLGDDSDDTTLFAFDPGFTNGAVDVSVDDLEISYNEPVDPSSFCDEPEPGTPQSASANTSDYIDLVQSCPQDLLRVSMRNNNGDNIPLHSVIFRNNNRTMYIGAALQNLAEYTLHLSAGIMYISGAQLLEDVEMSFITAANRASMLNDNVASLVVNYGASNGLLSSDVFPNDASIISLQDILSQVYDVGGDNLMVMEMINLKRNGAALVYAVDVMAESVAVYYSNNAILGLETMFPIPSKSYDVRNAVPIKDINGDGLDEFVMSVWYDVDPDGWGDETLSDYLFYGQANFPAEVALSSADIIFPAINQEMIIGGRDTAASGDVNGDEFNDLMRMSYNAETMMMEVHIHYGSSSGITTTPDVVIKSQGETDMLVSVKSGDINGDGFDDMAIGKFVIDEVKRARGASDIAVVLGSASLASEIVLSPDQAFAMISGEGQMGLRFEVVDKPDINRDGRADILIGAPNAVPGRVAKAPASGIGTGFLFYGREVWPENMDHIWAADNFFLPRAGDQQFGTEIIVPGDMNGDGYSEFIFVAAYVDPETFEFHTVYYIYDGVDLYKTDGLTRVRNKVFGYEDVLNILLLNVGKLRI